ncbi:hypothetical protein ACJMK2_040182 [Sinanodonta woodiana]|uniref:Uncharacterized protein n=1 Tax=Sinanodonta woodiana TaxID=1069815 RepID=A0ABD3WEF4_SINWO
MDSSSCSEPESPASYKQDKNEICSDLKHTKPVHKEPAEDNCPQNTSPVILTVESGKQTISSVSNKHADSIPKSAIPNSVPSKPSFLITDILSDRHREKSTASNFFNDTRTLSMHNRNFPLTGNSCSSESGRLQNQFHDDDSEDSDDDEKNREVCARFNDTHTHIHTHTHTHTHTLKTCQTSVDWCVRTTIYHSLSMHVLHFK